MPHHLMPNVFGACFCRQIIVLDVIRDRYILLSHAQSNAVAPHLGLPSAKPAAQSTSVLKQLIDTNLVTAATFPDIDPKLNTNSPPPSTGGMSADRWKLPADAFEHRPAWTSLIKAIDALRSAHGQVARRGLAGLLHLCTRAARQAEQRGLSCGRPDDYAPLVNALNWACLLYPKSTKCLEWCAALMLLCARAGLTLKLIIGVQSFPFYAHAWTEAGGAIIGDSARRREEMSVILEAPNPFLELRP
jgi:hypothetical protein